MPAIPTGFFDTVVSEVTSLKNLKDANGSLIVADPQVTFAAQWAYTQVCDEIDRPFHYGEYVEYHDEYTAPLSLRAFPLDLAKPVTVVVDGETVAPGDIQIIGSRIVLFGDAKDDVTVRYRRIVVTYYGGYTDCATNLKIKTAMVMQTTANYHRRELLGLRDTSGENGVSRSASDSGEILDSVKLILAKFVYTGRGYSIDGD